MSDLFILIIYIVVLILMLFFMIWPISVPFLIYYIIKKKQNKTALKKTIITRSPVYDSFVDISSYKLEHFNTNDLPVLKAYFGDIFIQFEKAYNNVDYNALYNICVPSLYELYKSDISIKLKLGEKKIIDDPSIEKIAITNSIKNDDQHEVQVMIRLKSKSYSITDTGKVISGNAVKPVEEDFLITFVRTFNKDAKETLRCPNCGATINSSKCEYCNTEFKQYDFKIYAINKLE